MLHKPISSQSKAWLLYVCLLSTFAGCSKCNKVIEPDNPTAGLPPATQVGAYTFGCMLNGQPWLPVGRQSLMGAGNPSADYDPTYKGGNLGIRATIYDNGYSKDDLGFNLTNVNKVGEYNPNNSDVGFRYNDGETPITEYFSEEDIASNCKLIITKLDLTNKIVAGTFSFTLQKKDTGKKVTVTDGRFDMKFL